MMVGYVQALICRGILRRLLTVHDMLKMAYNVLCRGFAYVNCASAHDGACICHLIGSRYVYSVRA